MKVVVAIDSFKGSLSSSELADNIELGVKKVFPDAQVIKLPIADGGEGTVEALVEATNGEIIKTDVTGPLGSTVNSYYGILGDRKTAVIEMATASGLPLIPKEARDPLKTSTFGTGELIKDAISKGCRKFIVGIGGSATNDGGMGMIEALGAKFFDANNTLIRGSGQALNELEKIDLNELLPELKECSFTIACDVDNPLFGNRGAAYVYAPQKGASEEVVKALDNGLKHFADIVKDQLNKDIAEIPGAGAAGGLGGGFIAFLDGVLKPGIDIVLDEVQLKEKIQGADFVLTGEGKIDEQSVMGKAPTGVSKLCKQEGVPVIAIAGCVDDSATATHDCGITSIFSVVNYPCSLEEAMDPKRASTFVQKNTEEIFRLIKAIK
jgi:glycerate kinase